MHEWLPLVEGQQVALDIEEERTRSYHPQIALLQITVNGKDAILDPIVLGHRELDIVIEHLLLSPRLIVVHGGRNDIAGLRRDFGIVPRSVADTQIAARFAGYRRFGLSSLLEKLFGIVLDKEARRSDWSKRPLTERQLTYAADDTRHLDQLWERLLEECEERGWKDAVIEECEVLAGTPADYTIFDPWGWHKLKAIKNESDEIKTRAAHIWRWRDSTGKDENRHPSQVLPNWAIEQAALRGVRWVRTNKQIQRILDDLPQRAAYALEEAIESNENVKLLRPRPRRKGARCDVDSETVKARYEALAQWREQVSRDTGLEAGWLAPRSVLECVARCEDCTREVLDEQRDELRQWRLVRYADDWLQILSSLG